MINKIVKPFSTVADYLSTTNLFKFGQKDYPSVLDYSRPFQISQTSNGIRVATQHMQSSIASVSVFIKCGSRNQSDQTSGVAHFLQHLHFKGTKNRTRIDLELEVQRMGGNLNAYTSRQNTSYMMTSFKKDIHKAVGILGDMLTNSLYRSQDIENQRGTIKRQLVQTRKSQPLQTTIQISHRGIFPNNQIALPILGDIKNMETINRDMITQYHSRNYVGNNIIIVGCGDINHNQLVATVQNCFKVPQKHHTVFKLPKPVFSPGMSTLHQPQMEKCNMVIVHQAPSFFQHQFFSYLLLQRLVADRPQNQFQLQIMKSSSCFKYQKKMSQYNFIQVQKGFYSSYWDTGLYGNYFLVSPDHINDVIKLNSQAYADYASQITEEQLERTKRKVYNEVLHHQTQNDITQSIANNLMYYNRRVHSKQLAQRIACVSTKDLNKIAEKVYTNMNNIHVTLWGNVPKNYRD